MFSHVVDVEEPISREEALSLAHFLNTELAGVPTRELLASLERRLLAVSDSFYHLVKRSLAILQTALATEPEARFLIEGTAYLFEQPEFRKDPRKAHDLLRQLDLQQELLERLRSDLATEGTHVRIGREVAIEGLDGCSYLLTPFSLHQTVIGGVGILGPKRMDYQRMRALVEGMADRVTDILTRWESGA
jgi:heat-inducible transcriptional repressor